ncbi:MAG: large conductance mechanosensitive channel protein MscL [Ruminococcaceae bacterium]|nr:large conductance mechanosensitive channel protein MscL [Oscillospiraceae bacterium]
MKKFLNEFKDFITKGNVLDMAVGVIIGAAFKDIVTSLTNNIIQPILDLIVKTEFGAKLMLKAPDGEIPGIYLEYGQFITAVINFLIMAFVIFLIVKAVKKAEELGNKLVKLGKKDEAAEEPAAPTIKTCPFCKSEIAIDATRCPHCTSVLED